MMTVQQILSILSSQKEELKSNELASFVSRYEEPLINLDSKMAQVVSGSGVVGNRPSARKSCVRR